MIREIWDREDEFKHLPEDTSDIKTFFDTVVLESLEILSRSTDIIYFIIDGINECPQTSVDGILTFLNLLQNVSSICMLITSQPHGGFVAVFRIG